MKAEQSTLRPVPLADLTKENLQAMLRDMDAQPGWYSSADLYTWYESMAREASLKAVTRKRFGTVMGQLGFRKSVRRVDGKHTRCWFIPRHAIRAAQAAAVAE